jgi:hypothetical protein
MMHINLPYQQAVGNSAAHTSKLNSLQNQLLQLWAIHGGENDSAWLMVMKHRAAEVLREVARWGWNEYQSICENIAAENACHLWCKCEALVITAAELDGMEESGLLHGCKQLLESGDLLIDSEEEILRLMDTGTEDYQSGHQNSELCWQQHFHQN